MAAVEVNVSKAIITNIKEFRPRQGGIGIDISIMAETDIGTVYFLTVLYDEEARKIQGKIREGYVITVRGDMKVESFPKLNGSEGWQLVIKRPSYLSISSDGVNLLASRATTVEGRSMLESREKPETTPNSDGDKDEDYLEYRPDGMIIDHRNGLAYYPEPEDSEPSPF